MKKLLLVLLLPVLFLGCALRAIAPSNRIAKSSQDFNLQIEEAQNKNLLLNIWRAKKRYPLYLTDTSKITGSLTNSYVLGLSIPIEKPMGYMYSASPSATFTQNPTFDVSVLNTQDFMRGFLAPITPAIFAYYLRQGWPPELLIHLMVREITIMDSPEVDKDNNVNDVPHYFTYGGKTTQHLQNYPDPAKEDEAELKEFSKWAHYLASTHLDTCNNTLLKGLSPSDFSALDSATKALMAGLNILPAEAKKAAPKEETPSKSTNMVTKTVPGTSTSAISTTTQEKNTPEETPSKRTSKVTRTFAGTSTSPNSTATENSNEFSKEDDPGQAYNVVVPFDILVADPSDPDTKSILDNCKLNTKKQVMHFTIHITDSNSPQEPPQAPATPHEDKKTTENNYFSHQLATGVSVQRVDRPDDKEASIQALLSVVETDDTDRPIVGSPRRTMIVKLSLRSPEAVLYYLGELARLEEYHGLTQRACVNGYLQPIFVAYSEGNIPSKCKGYINIEDSENEDVFIPLACDPNNPNDPNCQPNMRQECQEALAPIEHASKEVLIFKEENQKPQVLPLLTGLQCNGGRSMHSLSLLSQLISLQKSAKDFPTTPTVRAIGQ